MESPGAWVVGFESDNDEATNGEEDDVAARWVIEFGVESRVAISFIGLLEEGKVVTMEMHLFLWHQFQARDKMTTEGEKGGGAHRMGSGNKDSVSVL